MIDLVHFPSCEVSFMIELETGNLMKITKNLKMSKIGVVQKSSPLNFLRANKSENKLGVRVKETEIHIVQNVADWANSKVTTIELESKVVDFCLFKNMVLVVHEKKIVLFEVVKEGFLLNQAELEIESCGTPVKLCLSPKQDFILLSFVNNFKEQKPSKLLLVKLIKTKKNSFENDFMFKHAQSEKNFSFEKISEIDFSKTSIGQRKNAPFLHLSLDFRKKVSSKVKEQENKLESKIKKIGELPLIIAMQYGGSNSLLVYKFQENFAGGDGSFELVKQIDKYHLKTISDVKICGNKVWSVDWGGGLNRLIVKFVD